MTAKKTTKKRKRKMPKQRRRPETDAEIREALHGARSKRRKTKIKKSRLKDKRNVKGQWVKGQSGNPCGKPAGSVSIRAALRRVLLRIVQSGRKGAKARQLADMVAERLVERALEKFNDNPERAIALIMDHIDGKPTQTVVSHVHKDDDGPKFTPQELDDMIEAGKKAQDAERLEQEEEGEDE